MYCLFCVVLCIVCVHMCAVLLPPGGYPVAVKYIIISYRISYYIICHGMSYHIIYSISHVISYHIYHILYIISSYHIIKVSCAFRAQLLTLNSLLLKFLILKMLLYLLTYLLTQWSRYFLERLTVSQLVKKFPAFYGTQTFITAFTSARDLSQS